MNPTPEEKSVPAPAGAKLNITIGWIDRGLNRLRRLPLARLFEYGSRKCTVFGACAYYLLGVAGFVCFSLLGIKYGNWNPVGFGFGWFLLCILFNYLGTKFFSMLDRLVHNAPGKISSQALLDTLALLFIIVGALLLFFSCWSAVESRLLRPLWIGLGAFSLLELCAVMMLAPELVKTRVDKDCLPGEELLGVISLIFKSTLRLLPFVWLVVIALLTLDVVVSSFMPGRFAFEALLADLSYSIVIGVLPMAAYLAFLFYYLVIDVLRAILSLPEKLDALRR